jgi:hypothetical protein
MQLLEYRKVNEWWSNPWTTLALLRTFVLVLLSLQDGHGGFHHDVKSIPEPPYPWSPLAHDRKDTASSTDVIADSN